MAADKPISGERLEQYRSYLNFLAAAHLDPMHRRRVDPSDIVQLTLAEAFQKQEQFRGTADAELAGWLRQMLKHNVADAIRRMGRAKRNIRRERPLEADVEDSFLRVDAMIAAEQTSPSGHAVRDEQRIAVANAIARLPEDQRNAVVLYHIQQLKLKELAAHLGKSETAVAGLLYRGQRKLKQLLAAENS